MAAYLVLIHKETGKVYEGKDLIEVDEMLCAYMGKSVDPTNWCNNWMNWLGFTLATQSKPNLDHCSEENKKVCKWFEKTFDNISYFAR